MSGVAISVTAGLAVTLTGNFWVELNDDIEEVDGTIVGLCSCSSCVVESGGEKHDLSSFLRMDIFARLPDRLVRSALLVEDKRRLFI